MAKRLTSAERNTQRETEGAMEFKQLHLRRAALKPLTRDEAFDAGDDQQVRFYVWRMADAALDAQRCEARELDYLAGRIEDARRNLGARRPYSSDPLQNAGSANVQHAIWRVLTEHAQLLAYALGYYLPELMPVAELAGFERERRLVVLHDGAADCWRIAETKEPGAFPTLSDYLGICGTKVSRQDEPHEGDWQPLAFAEEWLAWRALAAHVKERP